LQSLVQVKGTTIDSPALPRLPVEVASERFNRLARLSAPTYLIGVDVVAYRTFVVAAVRPRRAKVSGISKAFPLGDDRVKLKLYREVLAYWAANRPLLLATEFADV